MRDRLNYETNPELFNNIDQKLLSRIEKTMERRSWKDDFPKISKELESLAHNNTPEHVSEIYYYTDALEILYIADDIFLANY